MSFAQKKKTIKQVVNLILGMSVFSFTEKNNSLRCMLKQQVRFQRSPRDKLELVHKQASDQFTLHLFLHYLLTDLHKFNFFRLK